MLLMGIVPSRTLRGRLALIAALTTLPTFLFVVYIAGKERDAALRRAESEARYVANLASREHVLQVSGARRVLETLASPEGLGGDGARELPALLRTILPGFPQVANLWIVTAEGTLEYSVVPPPQSIVIRDNPVFVEALRSKGVVTGRYQVGPIVGRPVLLMARALRSEGGTPQHVLLAALELSWLDQLARESGLPSRSVMVIADRDGEALAGAKGSIEGFADLVREPGTMRPATIDGVERLAVALPMGGVPDLWVVAGPPKRDVYAVANRIFFRDTLVLALLALFALGISFITTDLTVLRAVRSLEKAARRFGGGDLSVRVEVPPAAGEIHELATSFNDMAEALQERREEDAVTQQRLRALTERLSAAREDEAARIAQELHDQLGQELTALKFAIEALRRSSDDRGTLNEAIDVLDLGLDRAVDTVRRISSELRPSVLDRLGLVAGLEWLLRDFERRSGISTDIVAERGVEPVSDAVATALFRITQEALTNVARHAAASLVEVRLGDRGPQIELRLRDDGRGFDRDVVRERPSLGLLGIEERARRLGGTLVVESAPGSGTTLTVTVPRTPEGNA